MLHTINFGLSLKRCGMGIADIKGWRFFNKCNDYVYHYENKKGIKFEYYVLSSYMVIKTTTHSVLDRFDVTVNDYNEYMQELEKIVDVVINNRCFNKLELIRVDYYTDVKVEDFELSTYIDLLKHHNSSFKWATKKNEYDTSIHLNNKRRSIQREFI